MPAPRTLTRALTEIIIELAWCIESSHDDDVNPDIAVKWLEDITTALSDLTDEQREEMRTLVHQIAAEEPSGARRRFMEEFPKAFSLSDHEE
ncbi:hypothetical protein AB0M44_49335 [Streptosporangium subroseum]|uniref:hypothetical protein n=1 Tax=Streptosporangium subroseum TaxID=106412 RepID=UPI0034165B89